MNEWELTDDEVEAAVKTKRDDLEIFQNIAVAKAAQKKLVEWIMVRLDTKHSIPYYINFSIWRGDWQEVRKSVGL